MKHRLQSRNRFSISLRTLMLITTSVGLGASYVASANNQRQAADWVRSMGGRVSYHYYEYAANGRPVFNASGRPLKKGGTSFPSWLVDAIGPDYFCPVQTVAFGQPQGRQYYIENLDRLSAFHALKNLEFYSSRVECLSAVANVSGLLRLRLDAKDLSDIAPLSSCKELTSLEIHRSNVSDISPLRPLLKLQHLELCRAPVADLSPLLDHPALRSIDLSNTDVSDLAPLRSIKTLERVNLSYTLVTKQEVEALKRAFPGCKVIW
ncbi:MAG: leucine-rich repeat domain-containing protein [Aureliella sp.]